MRSDSVEEFTRWLKKHEIVDGESFGQGSGEVWLCEGVRAKTRFCDIVAREFTASGYTQVQLPYFIPQQIYTKQGQHFEGLSSITYRAVANDDPSSPFLRTTSETPFTYLFRDWVPIHGLPLRYFQVVSVFRHEEEQRLQPLLRSREITPFIESYSAFSSSETAALGVDAEIQVYRHILEIMCIPYLLSRRPEFDTFPEALYTMAFDVILPSGQVIQIATVHHLGDSFGRAFDVRAPDDSYIWQTSTGISGRAIGCALAIHRDGDGIVLPYALSPRQVGIGVSGSASEGRRLALRDSLVSESIARADSVSLLDDAHRTTWLESGGCILVCLDETGAVITARDGSELAVRPADVVSGIRELVASYSHWLMDRAMTVRNSYLSGSSISSAVERDYVGIVEVPYCGDSPCLEQLRVRVGNHGSVLGASQRATANYVCEFCGRPATCQARVAMGEVDYH